MRYRADQTVLYMDIRFPKQCAQESVALQRREITMKLVMNMVRKPFKQGDVIFETTERSDELYLIHTGSVEIRSHEGLVLATLNQGELFGEMASIMGERERTATAVAGANTVIDVIDATTM